MASSSTPVDTETTVCATVEKVARVFNDKSSTVDDITEALEEARSAMDRFIPEAKKFLTTYSAHLVKPVGFVFGHFSSVEDAAPRTFNEFEEQRTLFTAILQDSSITEEQKQRVRICTHAAEVLFGAKYQQKFARFLMKIHYEEDKTRSLNLNHKLDPSLYPSVLLPTDNSTESIFETDPEPPVQQSPRVKIAFKGIESVRTQHRSSTVLPKLTSEAEKIADALKLQAIIDEPETPIHEKKLASARLQTLLTEMKLECEREFRRVLNNALNNPDPAIRRLIEDMFSDEEKAFHIENVE